MQNGFEKLVYAIFRSNVPLNSYLQLQKVQTVWMAEKNTPNYKF